MKEENHLRLLSDVASLSQLPAWQSLQEVLKSEVIELTARTADRAHSLSHAEIMHQLGRISGIRFIMGIASQANKQSEKARKKLEELAEKQKIQENDAEIWGRIPEIESFLTPSDVKL